MEKKWKYFFATLVLGVTSVWFAVFSYPDQKLHLIACDVGQGDAILAVFGGTQILIDGGSNKKVLECLDSHLPFWDRTIELVVLTHPQTDHFGGLIDVFKTYEVEKFLATSLDSSSHDYQVLKEVVGGSGVEVINPTSGMVIRLGTIYLDIVWPTSKFLEQNFAWQATEEFIQRQSLEPQGLSLEKLENVLGSFTTSRDPNDFSIVAILRYGEFDALLTGDIGPDVTDKILASGLIGEVEYIKIPHHGSKNGLTQNLLDATSPEVAVISSGKSNSYGHPHREVLDMLSCYGLRVFRTDLSGNVEIVSDGEKFWVVD
jgi:competence protein ComEC